MSSIRWIRNLLVDGEPMSVEIMLGASHISDKCYVRINNESEMYFRPESETRSSILAAGIEILKNHFADKSVTNANGAPYDWS